MECLKDKKGQLLDNVDFCNVKYVPSFNSNFKAENSWDASYIHASMWRFLALGDAFVDIFMSRDSDSNILQREVDSVNVWLKSSKVGHMMRGNIFSKMIYLG